MTDRTLDQQCTVTRPGIAAIASALLVEMLVSVIQHPQGALAPGSQSQNEDRGSHPLGIVPHQIRGYLSEFRNLVIKGSSYDCCSACSSNITSAYESQGWEFVKKALDSRGYVEELSGLAAVSLGYLIFWVVRKLTLSRSSERLKRPWLISNGAMMEA